MISTLKILFLIFFVSLSACDARKAPDASIAKNAPAQAPTDNVEGETPPKKHETGNPSNGTQFHEDQTSHMNKALRLRIIDVKKAEHEIDRQLVMHSLSGELQADDYGGTDYLIWTKAVLPLVVEKLSNQRNGLPRSSWLMNGKGRFLFVESQPKSKSKTLPAWQGPIVLGALPFRRSLDDLGGLSAAQLFRFRDFDVTPTIRDGKRESRITANLETDDPDLQKNPILLFVMGREKGNPENSSRFLIPLLNGFGSLATHLKEPTTFYEWFVEGFAPMLAGDLTDKTADILKGRPKFELRNFAIRTVEKHGGSHSDMVGEGKLLALNPEFRKGNFYVRLSYDASPPNNGRKTLDVILENGIGTVRVAGFEDTLLGRHFRVSDWALDWVVKLRNVDLISD